MSYPINGPTRIGDTGQLNDLLGDMRLANITSNFGDVLYADASNNLKALVPGSSGAFLQTRGVGNSPIWSIPTRPYDAVVSTSGAPGTYPLLSAAIADGKSDIYVETGTYVETTQITLPDDVSITGAGVAHSKIVFAGLVAPALYFPLPGNLQSTGTISIAHNTSSVTGVGTTFTSLAPNDLIFIGGANYLIASITDNTTLTISEPYRGASVTNNTYVALTTGTPVVFSQISFLNSPGTPSTNLGMSLNGINGVYFDRVVIAGFVGGCLMNLCSAGLLGTFLVRSCAGVGLSLQDCVNFSLSVCFFFNNLSHGLAMSGSVYKCTGITIDQTNCLNNTGRGADINGPCEIINFTNTVIKRNFSDGIRCNSSTNNIILSQCNVVRNAVGINHSGVHNIISGCAVTDNTSTGIIVGNEAMISNCVIANNAGVGLDVGSAQDCTITANIIHNNTSHGFSISGNTQACTITGNSIYSNSGNGLNITGGASGSNTISTNAIRSNAIGIYVASDDNVIVGNRVDQCTTGISIPATSARTLITGNNIRGNTTNLNNLSGTTVLGTNITV